MDRKIELSGGGFKEVSEGEIARALLDWKSVLIATSREDWARRVHQAWTTEIADNPIPGVDTNPDHEKMHTAFTNGAVLQIVIVAHSSDLQKLRGVRFDLVKPILMDVALASELIRLVSGSTQ